MAPFLPIGQRKEKKVIFSDYRVPYTVVAIEVRTIAFWPIKHSILELFSRFLVCMYSFYIQKWGTKNMSKIGHSCQVLKMA